MPTVDLVEVWKGLPLDVQLWLGACVPFAVYCAMGLRLGRGDQIMGAGLILVLPKPVVLGLQLRSALREGPPRGIERYLQPFGAYVPEGDEPPEWKLRAEAAVDEALARRGRRF